ncbi:protein translocase subunit SecD [Actinospongicola halichondriae]|uniref:protein translocase subunit SecD n=1 Tax=Actinospongicola halichondriae TaxID=3236844 RepID=UPI003D578801
MRRNGLYSLIFIVLLAAAGLTTTVVSGNEPLLGLDLQGGVSVVLQPTEDTNDEAIGQAIEIIRQRVDGIGVAEPEIARQGDAIVVQLPGVKDRERALELVGQTAELRFRPVLQVIPPELANLDPNDLQPDESTTTTVAEDESTTTTTAAEGSDESGFGIAPGESAAPLQTDDTTGDTTTTTEAPTTSAPVETPDLTGLEGLALTDPADDVAEEPVTLSEYDDDGNEVLRYRLGPTEATGTILSGAEARLGNIADWTVGVTIKGGSIDEFNDIAFRCFNRDASCPTGQLAIVLDSQVQSAPSINEPSFAADAISISGTFTEGEAKDLALVLRYGSLPVELEPQQTQSISASLGQDALDAGVIAGLLGLALVALYMVIYYRLLGVVAILSLSVSAALLWTLIAYLGENQGLALTLAGVTGIIVSIGVAVDSNVVFYEHLKEDVWRGRTLRTAVDGSFTSAFSTIVKADVASLIGAGILYMLTVGPVRGFALYLGLSTMLDLVASYFFMRPLAVMLVKSERLQDKPRWFGMPVPKAEEGATA